MTVIILYDSPIQVSFSHSVIHQPQLMYITVAMTINDTSEVQLRVLGPQLRKVILSAAMKVWLFWVEYVIITYNYHLVI